MYDPGLTSRVSPFGLFIILANVAKSQASDTLTRELSLQYTGKPLSTAGDVNSDGFDDIVIGSPAAGTLSQGYAYLVFGGADLPASTDLEAGLTGVNGVTFQGALTGEYMRRRAPSSSPCYS